MELTGPQCIIQIRVWLGQTCFAVYEFEIWVWEYEWLSNCAMFRNAVLRLRANVVCNADKNKFFHMTVIR